MMSNEELGLDTFIQLNGEDQLITITDNSNGEKKEFQLEQSPFVRHSAIVSRGTTCYRTSDQETVVKFSWTPDKRHPEAKYLNLARERGVTELGSLLVEIIHVLALTLCMRKCEYACNPSCRTR